jgi:hypothetical protein
MMTKAAKTQSATSYRMSCLKYLTVNNADVEHDCQWKKRYSMASTVAQSYEDQTRLSDVRNDGVFPASVRRIHRGPRYPQC